MSTKSEKDLIRRGDVLELLYYFKENKDCPKNYGTLLTIIRKVCEMPTAYNIDAVVEQLDKAAFYTVEETKHGHHLIGIFQAIEIVKGGAV